MHVELSLIDNDTVRAGNSSFVDASGAYGVPPSAFSAAIEQRIRAAAALQPPPRRLRIRRIHRLVPLHCSPRRSEHGVAALLPQLAGPQRRVLEPGPVQLEENLVVAVRVAAHPFELVEDRELRRAWVV